MRSPNLLRAVALAGLASILAVSPAGADFVYYSWSGRVEPAMGADNPWGLLGDGLAGTADGTPYKARALVASDAVDLDGSLNPDFARFAPILLLEIGDDIAAVSNAQLSMSDDAFGTLDSILLSTNAELFGTTLSMSMDIRVPIDTFALSDAPAPDLPPVFTFTFPVQFGGAGTSDLITIPDNAAVTGRLQTCGATPIPVSWTSTTTGTAGDVAVTIEGLLQPGLGPGDFELQTADYAAAPLCSTTLQLEYLVPSNWTVTLEDPVAALLVYAKFWRGSGAGIDPATYRFDEPFTIVSGFAGASVGDGNTVLSLPTSSFHDGILRFDGPISSLGVESNALAPAYQVMTLAVEVPEPGAAAAAFVAFSTLLGVARRRSRSALAARRRRTHRRALSPTPLPSHDLPNREAACASAANGPPTAARTTSPTTTRNGACRCTTTTGCSSS